MIETNTAPYTAVAAASEQLKSARAQEPHPLHPLRGEVEAYVAALQSADREIELLLRRAGETLPASEIEALKRKRAAIDASIRRQALLAGRRLGTDRQGSAATLNALFKLGSTPDPALDGRYYGDLISTTMFSALDAFGKGLSRLWFPWTGKRFNAATQTGDNVFTSSATVAGRLFWPTFSNYRPYQPGLYTAFDFHTYTGPGLVDPEITVLKLDYDNSANPNFLVRSVVDELVQLSGNYYLGKAFLRNSGGGYSLAAFFALRKSE